MERDDFRNILSEKISSPVVPLSSLGQMADGNMANLSPTIPINISRDHGKVENVYIGESCFLDEIKEYTNLLKYFHDIFAWSYKEIPGIDPHIVEHEIKTYPIGKPVRQHLHAVNPRKVPTIKAKIEKLLKVDFIYPVPLTKWVSNPILVDKKQGAIFICTYFHDFNRAYPKDNFPTPFIDHILDECVGSEVFSLWMDFPGIIRYKLNPRTNTRLHLFVLGELLHIERCPSALKTPELRFSGP